MDMPKSCGECDLCVCYVLEDGTKENYRCPITLYVIHNFDEQHKHCPLDVVVRCKDCRHRDPEDHKCDCGQLERVGCVFPVDDDYFCAYGERRGET